MERYFIYAYEALYQGLYGISLCEIIEAKNEKEVEEVSEDLSREVISLFCPDDYEGDSWEETEENIQNGISYDYFLITNDTLSADELIEEYEQLGLKEFIKKYGGIV